MRMVYKFKLEFTDKQEVLMPSGAEVVHVSEQYGNLCLWALCDPVAEKVKRVFRIAGTGNGFVPDGSKHLGTVIMAGGAFVWHVFEAVG